ALADEKYATARAHEASALVKLGEREGLRAPLAAFLGATDPMIEAVGLARDAGILDAKNGGWAVDKPAPTVKASIDAPGGPSRLAILLAEDGEVTLSIGGQAVAVGARSDRVRFVDLDRPRGRIDV